MVHWVIVTDEQVERGIKSALARVSAPGVFVEGNSFTEFVDVDFMLMVARAGGGKIKSTARRALSKASAVYLSDLKSNGSAVAREAFARWRSGSFADKLIGKLPVYTRDDLPQLIAQVQRIHLGLAA
jgi:hypothetical protein